MIGDVMKLDTSHVRFCRTDKDREVLTDYLVLRSERKVAAKHNVSKTAIHKRLAAIKKTAEIQGYAPENDQIHTAPDAQLVKGVSTLYGDDGKVKMQWVKTDRKRDEQLALMKEIIDSLSETIEPREFNPATLSHTDDNLLNAYIVTDYYLGMLAWGEETRQGDWDLQIAEGVLVKWFEQAIAQSPASETAILANIGDMLHWDGMDTVTPTSGHILDADTRFQKLVRVAIRVLVKITDMLLQKHDKVHVLHATGNHDLASSVWLRELFALYYGNNPRVTVDTSPDVYYSYEFGQVSLFFHHGHKRNPGNVSEVMAGKFREIYGRTKYSYCHMGDKHHKQAKENSMMIVEQHQTLISPDAYASTGGWLSDSSAQTITYQKDFGEVSRVRISQKMVR